MMIKSLKCIVSILLSVLLVSCSSANEPLPSIAVLDFELHDDMQYGGHSPGHEGVVRRTQSISDAVNEAANKSARYNVIDLQDYPEELHTLKRSNAYIHNCKACYINFAKKIGADYVLIGWVQRVSNLIIGFNLHIIDVETGNIFDGSSIDIRGNTDKTWNDGTRYLLERMKIGL